MTDPVYLDYNATTPIAPEVLEAMLPWLREQHGNPSSSHPFGKRAAQAVATARQHVASLVGAQPNEILFTGCATESNNLAITGVAQALAPAKRHVVVSAVEHPAVMASALALRSQGWEVTVVPVDGAGRISLDQLERSLGDDTALVSVMHSNNEVGTLQPIREIAALTRPRGIVLHTDAAQSAGKVPLDVDELGVDLLTIAGHKFYAPKGIAALYVRAGTPIRAVLHGAGQEQGLRSGTENVASIVALGAASLMARTFLTSTMAHLRKARERLHAKLGASIPGLALNGDPDKRLPNTLHVSFPGVSGRALLAAVADTVAASVGMACHSEQDTVSGVLAAMDVDADRATGAVRLSVGRMTTDEDVDRAAAALAAAWKQLHK